MSSIKFSLVQSHLYWEEKERNREMLAQKIFSIQEHTHIVVLPEMFTTGFTTNLQLAEPPHGDTFLWIKNIAIQKKVAMVGSWLVKEHDIYYNRLVCMLPNGQYGYYNKRHLFPLGNEKAYLQAGMQRFICSINGWKIQFQICYDLRFPVWARQQLRQKDVAEYDILLNIANWPSARIDHWKTLLKARAIENQCYVIGVNRVGTDGNNIHYDGNTSVKEASGNILLQKENVETIIHIALHKNEIQRYRASFPFLGDTDTFLIV